MTGLDPSEALLRHAIKRFKERTGIYLQRHEYERMNEAIRAGRVPHVAYSSANVRVFKVRVAGVTAYAAWNPKHQQIGTFYPDLTWVTAKGGSIEADWAKAGPEQTVLGAG